MASVELGFKNSILCSLETQNPCWTVLSAQFSLKAT